MKKARREGPAGRSVGGPLADSRRHGDAARFQLHRPGYPGIHPENCTGCMDCVTACPDTAILGKVLGESEFEKTAGRDSRSGRSRDVRKQWSKTRKYYEGPEKKGARAGCSRSSSTPASAKAAPSASPSATTTALKMIPKTEQVMTDVRKSHRLFKQVGPSRRAVHQRQPADRHDAQGADAHLHRRGRQLCRLRRRDGAADDVRGHRGQVRRPVGHRRRHRLQHGLYLDVSVQSVPGAVDQFAVRKRPGRWRWAFARAGTRWAGTTSRCGASAATGRCSTSASSRCRGCSPPA